jgi:hypothetical protein
MGKRKRNVVTRVWMDRSVLMSRLYYAVLEMLVIPQGDLDRVLLSSPDCHGIVVFIRSMMADGRMISPREVGEVCIR